MSRCHDRHALLAAGGPGLIFQAIDLADLAAVPDVVLTLTAWQQELFEQMTRPHEPAEEGVPVSMRTRPRAGDVVRLAGLAGPRMLVESVNGDVARLVWHDGVGELQRAELPLTLLEPAAGDEGEGRPS